MNAALPTSPLADMGMADFLAVQRLYAEYALALDAGDWDRWPGFFIPDGCYRLQPRDNFERGLPLATLWFESQGALRDRVYGIKETLFHDPYYQRHIVGAPLIHALHADGSIECEASYVVIRIKPSQAGEVFNTGRYIDRIVPTPEGLRFASRWVIYDTELVLNSIIYPI